jgi:hypothetical protein
MLKSLDKILKDLPPQRPESDESKQPTAKTAEQLGGGANAVAAFNAKVSRLREQIKELQESNKQLRKRFAGARGEVVRPDGRIVQVSQRLGTVWVNLGSADGLKPRITFGVYPRKEGETITGPPKASIQITSVANEHLAEAQITRDESSDPILPQDWIYSPAWRQGLRDHFAIAGFIDMDGDGKSDEESLRRLISLNGGEIDATLLPDGSLTGEIEPDTLYLIVGKSPDPALVGAKAVDTYRRFVDRAVESGLKRLTLSELLNQMGWRPETSSTRQAEHAEQEGRNTRSFR